MGHMNRFVSTKPHLEPPWTNTQPQKCVSESRIHIQGHSKVCSRVPPDATTCKINWQLWTSNSHINSIWRTFDVGMRAQRTTIEFRIALVDEHLQALHVVWVLRRTLANMREPTSRNHMVDIGFKRGGLWGKLKV